MSGIGSNIKYNLGEEISILLPEKWEIYEDEELFNIHSKVNPKGVIQVSIYKRINFEISLDEIAQDYCDRFIDQFSINVDINTKMLLKTDNYTISQATGTGDGRFVKVWCFAEKRKVLLVTYNSDKKTREVSSVDNIVYSIQFNNGKS